MAERKRPPTWKLLSGVRRCSYESCNALVDTRYTNGTGMCGFHRYRFPSPTSVVGPTGSARTSP
jgi:hypothetical protein